MDTDDKLAIIKIMKESKEVSTKISAKAIEERLLSRKEYMENVKLDKFE